ncbi:trypsin-like serine protease [Streptomyces sp. NPDC001404]|uniref:trypsin-like serine protease n=1 Tax=Streptomyces sp. NPDC001404 TaxID=3364571 RepID=UPI0036A2AE45
MFGRRSRAAWTAGVLAATATATTLTALAASPAAAVVGSAAENGQYAFTAKLDIGNGKRSCTGALVDAQWVLTAASCFSDDPAQGYRITAGAPKEKTTVTVGRTDLTTETGTTVDAVELTPRGDRDLVMVRLAKPVTGISPVTVGTAAPRQGDELRVTGYGRTKDEWVPDRLHTGLFGVDAVRDGSVGISGKGDASICKGDTGGPALREQNGTVELTAISSTSWQGGCFGNEDETRKGAVSTRVDDVNSWIQQLRLTSMYGELTNVVTTADFNGDGRTDVAAVLKSGRLVAFYAGPDGTLEYGRELWHDNSWDGMRKIVGGDFDGDGKADIVAVGNDGTLLLYRGNDRGTLDPRRPMWRDKSWGNMAHIARYKDGSSGRDGLLAVWDDGSLFSYPTGADGILTGQRREMWRDKTWTKRHVATGDFNGDGREDIAAVATDGTLQLYAGNAKGTFDNARSMWRDKSWDTMQYILAGDFDGNGKADLTARWGRGNLAFYAGDGNGALADGRAMWPAVG